MFKQLHRIDNKETLAFEGGLILQFIVDLPDGQMLPLGEQCESNISNPPIFHYMKKSSLSCRFN